MSEENYPLKKADSWRMFNEISPKYDFLNHFLSFGIDIFWRKRLVKFLPNQENITLLDLATGTADVVITLVEANANIASAFGIDMAEKMLEVGRKKLTKRNLNNKITLQAQDAANLTFENESFNATTIAFGIRNIPDTQKAIDEMFRVLKKEGCTLILEFSLPENKIIRALHIFYLRHIVPILGWVFSGNYSAYKYLNQTIEDFPYGEAFCQLMKKSGFKNVKAHPLLFGIATIYQGDK